MNQNTIKPGMNSESKARFFAQYWGQKVVKDDVYTTHIINGTSIGLFLKNGFLELTSLSDITDEDKQHIEKSTGQPFYSGDFSFCIFRHSIPHINFTIDYLRSKGYALPWMGYSVDNMVQAGWIKLKGGK